MQPDLSIVIPAYNESDRITGPLRTVIEYLKTQPFAAEVIVVDDGSSDDTTAAADAVFSEFPRFAGRTVRYETNRGKGYAVKTGMLAAAADIVLFSDADLSTPIEELHKLVDPIKNGEFDVTFGSRALDRSLIGTHQPWRREQGGKVFNLVVRLMTGMPFWDTQCGFKAFSMPKFRPLLDVMQIERFGFDVEFLYVARLHGLRLKEIAVRWNNDDRSKVNVLRDSVRMFDEVRQIRRNARRGEYAIKAD
jgi:glycosyltransferase involved in cell wall biosynthesis